MAVPEFKILKRYSLRGGDVVLLPFFDEKTPCFPMTTAATLTDPIHPPETKGGKRVVHASTVKEKGVMVITVRLDSPHLSPEASLKKAVASAIADYGEGFSRVVVMLDSDHAFLTSAVQEGALLGGYRFDKYLSERKPLPSVATFLPAALSVSIEERLDREAILFKWVNFARDILNEPPNAIDPVSLAEIFRSEGKKAGMKVTVWDEKRLEKERCGGVLAVGMGSEHPPRMVIGQYKGRKASSRLVLIGKGITFDTGGYCLKPPSAQEGMKYDMSGAAAVFAAACALAQLKVPVNLTVITPLAENAISHRSFMTSDIIVTRCGKSVQVDNTDAEGRLILADALCLASEQQPDVMIDVATLTGACVVALGEDVAGLFSNSRDLAMKIIESGESVQEHFWELPLYAPYSEQLKAEVADLKNIGGKWGGAITAALFLKEFIDEKTTWAHLDIAGPGVKEEALDHLGKGAKGFGVKTLVTLASRLVAES